MNWFLRWLSRRAFLGIALAAVLLPAPPAHGQVRCGGEYAPGVVACELGVPQPGGTTLPVRLESAAEARAYAFEVPSSQAMAYVYVGDLWYDLDVELWRESPTGSRPGQRVASTRQGERRVLQYVRPALFAELLQGERYWVVVRAADPERFAPARGFTLRVALAPRPCDLQRHADGLYALALSGEPEAPSAFSLLSFTAYLSPPYSDLFDYAWEIDGQPVATSREPVLQVAATDLPNAGAAEHRVRVTARGVRPYPDPEPQYRHLPPTLTAECQVRMAPA